MRVTESICIICMLVYNFYFKISMPYMFKLFQENEKKEETSVKLQTLESTDDIEDIGQKAKTAVIETVKMPKKIKF